MEKVILIDTLADQPEITIVIEASVLPDDDDWSPE